MVELSSRLIHGCIIRFTFLLVNYIFNFIYLYCQIMFFMILDYEAIISHKFLLGK